MSIHVGTRNFPYNISIGLQIDLDAVGKSSYPKNTISKTPLKALNKKTITVSFTGSDTISGCTDQCTRFRDNWKSECSQFRTTLHDYMVLHILLARFSQLEQLLNTRPQRSVYVCDASRSAEVNESGFRAVHVG